jgi:hypothetical protein
MRDVSPASSSGPMAPRPDMIPRTANYTAESSPEPSDPFFFGPATPEYHYQDTFMASGFDGSQSPASFSEAGSLVSGWSNDDQLMFGTSADMFAPIPQYPVTAPPFVGHVRSSSMHSQPEMFTQMEALSCSPQLANQAYFPMAETVFAQEKMVQSPPQMIPAPPPTPPVAAAMPSHDCTQFAFQTLNSLYAPPSSQPSANDFNGSSDGLPTLDSVLSTNKTAVDKLYVLLGCPCSANPHFSTTIAFTVTKILSWYQAIAGVSSQDDFPVNTPMEAFTHTPISLGDFRLEVEDEDTFRTQLVLGELRKVEKLIDKFSDRYCKAANPAETGIEGGVYGALEQLLRTRVRDTFKVTMRTAPEDIKRRIALGSQSRVRFNTM